MTAKNDITSLEDIKLLVNTFTLKFKDDFIGPFLMKNRQSLETS
jgi:hypothetical protein